MPISTPEKSNTDKNIGEQFLSYPIETLATSLSDMAVSEEKSLAEFHGRDKGPL